MYEFSWDTNIWSVGMEEYFLYKYLNFFWKMELYLHFPIYPDYWKCDDKALYKPWVPLYSHKL